MDEQQAKRLVCPGCSHNIQDDQQQQPQPDAFRYLTIEEMEAEAFRCQNLSCPIYIEQDETFANNAVQPRKTTIKHIFPVQTTSPTKKPKLHVQSPQRGAPTCGRSVQANSRALIRNRWTKDELDLLSEMRTKGCSWEEIGKALPQHTARSAESKWFQLCVLRKS